MSRDHADHCSQLLDVTFSVATVLIAGRIAIPAASVSRYPMSRQRWLLCCLWCAMDANAAAFVYQQSFRCPGPSAHSAGSDLYSCHDMSPSSLIQTEKAEAYEHPASPVQMQMWLADRGLQAAAALKCQQWRHRLFPRQQPSQGDAVCDRCAKWMKPHARPCLNDELLLM
jgi:hypothetical protein